MLYSNSALYDIYLRNRLHFTFARNAAYISQQGLSMLANASMARYIAKEKLPVGWQQCEAVRIKLIGCEVVASEVKAALSASPHEFDVQLVDQGLHMVGQKKMPLELQRVIDEVDQENFDAILLLYGLCNNGIVGLTASIPIIVPRAHDCITFYMGSKERYREYFDAHPGTYYYATGWSESLTRGQDSEYIDMRARYVEQFGEEEADYLMEVLGGGLKYYDTLSFVNTGTGDVETFREIAQRVAREREWEFIEYTGDTTIFENALNGNWDESAFQIINPGETIKPSYNDLIIKSEKIDT